MSRRGLFVRAVASCVAGLGWAAVAAILVRYLVSADALGLWGGLPVAIAAVGAVASAVVASCVAVELLRALVRR